LFFTHIKSNIIMRIVLSTIPSPSPSLSLSLSLPLTLPLPPSHSPSPSLSFSLSFSLSLSYPARLRGRRRASAPTRGCSADAGLRPRLYNPRPHSHFLLFLSFAFGWSCGICLATPISTCKGRSVTSILRGILLRFLQSKNSRVVFILLDGVGHLSCSSLVFGEGTSTPSRNARNKKGLRTSQAVKRKSLGIQEF
jgi:hypothetical protein